MKYTETMEQLKALEKKAKEAQRTYHEAAAELGHFMKENFGVSEGEVITPSGTIEMMAKVWDMKDEEKVSV